MKMSQITVEMVRKIFPYCPKAKAELYTPLFNEILPKYGIATAKRLAAFFATLGQESGELKYTSELADGWAYDISVNPRKARKLGNLTKGDGPKFKGHCLIQITGKSNHQSMTDDFGAKEGVDFVINPKLLTQPRWAVEGAAWFWKTSNCNKYADASDFDGTQGIINRGDPEKKALDLAKRQAYYRKALTVFSASFKLTPMVTLKDAPASTETTVDPPVKIVETTTKSTEIGNPVSETIITGSIDSPASSTDSPQPDPLTLEQKTDSADSVGVKRERPSFASMVQAAFAWVLSGGVLVYGAIRTFFESLDQIPTINIVVVLGFILAMSFLGYLIYNRSADRAASMNLANLENAGDRTKATTHLK